jgi:hypothetical protein
VGEWGARLRSLRERGCCPAPRLGAQLPNPQFFDFWIGRSLLGNSVAVCEKTTNFAGWGCVVESRVWCALAVLLLLASAEPAFAAAGDLDLTGFYGSGAWTDWSPSSLWKWAGYIVPGLVAGAVVYFSGGTLAPGATAIAGWIGGFVGLSGAAATSYGFALLGGGSLAAGGFGAIGGKALVTAALTVGVAGAKDAATTGLDSLVVAWATAAPIKEQQAPPITYLPFPRVEIASERYKLAIKSLSGFDTKADLSAPQNKALIQSAIANIKLAEVETLKPLDAAVVHTSHALLALTESDSKTAASESAYALLLSLGRSKNDVLNAIFWENMRPQKTTGPWWKRYASDPKRLISGKPPRPSLPSFIWAIAAVSDPSHQLALPQAALETGFELDPDHPLAPLIVAMYLDRMELRPNADEGVAYNQLYDVLDRALIAGANRDKSMGVLVARTMLRLEMNDQLVAALEAGKISGATIHGIPIKKFVEDVARRQVVLTGLGRTLLAAIQRGISDRPKELDLIKMKLADRQSKLADFERRVATLRTKLKG